MSGDYAYVFDEYVNGTPERQARYIADFRINLANLRTVVGSELAGRVEILGEAVLHSSTAHERLLRAGLLVFWLPTSYSIFATSWRLNSTQRKVKLVLTTSILLKSSR